MLRRGRLLLMDVGRAMPSDWPSIRDLLEEVGLPLYGAESAFVTGLVARDGERVVGCAALEPFDGAALLRSVAVTPSRRGTGVGQARVHATEQLARDAGAAEVILLTDTAEPWFRRLGYQRVERSAVPADVAGSVEFVVACSESAVAMRRTLA